MNCWGQVAGCLCLAARLKDSLDKPSPVKGSTGQQVLQLSVIVSFSIPSDTMQDMQAEALPASDHLSLDRYPSFSVLDNGLLKHHK